MKKEEGVNKYWIINLNYHLKSGLEYIKVFFTTSNFTCRTLQKVWAPVSENVFNFFLNPLKFPLTRETDLLSFYVSQFLW